MVDYSRFDHIETDSDDEETKLASINKPKLADFPPPTQMTKKGKEGRFKFEYEGRTIFEWEQSLEEVSYIS